MTDVVHPVEQDAVEETDSFRKESDGPKARFADVADETDGHSSDNNEKAAELNLLTALLSPPRPADRPCEAGERVAPGPRVVPAPLAHAYNAPPGFIDGRHVMPPFGPYVEPPIPVATQGKPETFNKTRRCKYFDAGWCWQGDGCEFAHGDQEVRARPDLFRTELCFGYTYGGRCNYGDRCRFAHGERQLMAEHPAKNETKYPERTPAWAQRRTHVGDKAVQPRLPQDRAAHQREEAQLRYQECVQAQIQQYHMLQGVQEEQQRQFQWAMQQQLLLQHQQQFQQLAPQEFEEMRQQAEQVRHLQQLHQQQMRENEPLPQPLQLWEPLHQPQQKLTPQEVEEMQQQLLQVRQLQKLQHQQLLMESAGQQLLKLHQQKQVRENDKKQQPLQQVQDMQPPQLTPQDVEEMRQESQRRRKLAHPPQQQKQEREQEPRSSPPEPMKIPEPQHAPTVSKLQAEKEQVEIDEEDELLKEALSAADGKMLSTQEWLGKAGHVKDASEEEDVEESEAPADAVTDWQQHLAEQLAAYRRQAAELRAQARAMAEFGDRFAAELSMFGARVDAFDSSGPPESSAPGSKVAKVWRRRANGDIPPWIGGKEALLATGAVVGAGATKPTAMTVGESELGPGTAALGEVGAPPGLAGCNSTSELGKNAAEKVASGKWGPQPGFGEGAEGAGADDGSTEEVAEEDESVFFGDHVFQF